MSHLVKGKVTRFEIPGVYGFNFLLTQSLGFPSPSLFLSLQFLFLLSLAYVLVALNLPHLTSLPLLFFFPLFPA